MLRNGFILAALGLAIFAGPVLAVTTEEEPKAVHWTFQGPLGKFDQGQLQRGYKVYREVCSSCHSMNLMSFRNLGQKGGPFFLEEFKKNANDNPVVKAIAKDYQFDDIDTETGDIVKRAGTSADRFPNPRANESAARASNGGALPPDLSTMAKAREGGPAYIYSLLTGYQTPPKGMTVPAGKYYNPYMPGDMSGFWAGDPADVPEGGFIAMPPPLVAGKVTFDDGTNSTLDQQAKDVAAFLAWASEPKMEERKSFGLAAMIYLVIFSTLLWFSYKRIWRNVSH